MFTSVRSMILAAGLMVVLVSPTTAAPPSVALKNGRAVLQLKFKGKYKYPRGSLHIDGNRRLIGGKRHVVGSKIRAVCRVGSKVTMHDLIVVKPGQEARIPKGASVAMFVPGRNTKVEFLQGIRTTDARPRWFWRGEIFPANEVTRSSEVRVDGQVGHLYVAKGVSGWGRMVIGGKNHLLEAQPGKDLMTVVAVNKDQARKGPLSVLSANSLVERFNTAYRKDTQILRRK